MAEDAAGRAQGPAADTLTSAAAPAERPQASASTVPRGAEITVTRDREWLVVTIERRRRTRRLYLEASEAQYLAALLAQAGAR